jgi:Delta7-sterol 5-desaturase
VHHRVTRLLVCHSPAPHARPAARSRARPPCAGGHAGYEICPFIPTLEQLAWFACGGRKPAKGLNTVLHHDMHHRYPTKHFSLYFTHWDRLMSTLHPKYDASVVSYY